MFSWNVHLTIFKVVLSWIGVCTALYGFITVIPIFRHDSPCYSPLTPLAKPVVAMIPSVLILLYYICFYPFLLCLYCCRSPLVMSGDLIAWFYKVLGTIHLTPEKAALNSSSEVDTRALMWTLDSLDEDHELEYFFSVLPGFHNSKVLKQPLHSLDSQQWSRLSEAVIRLLDRTFSSNSLPDQAKHHRADICVNAMKLVDPPNPKAFPDIVRRLASEDRYGPLQSCKIVDFVRRWGSGKCELSPLDQTIFSIVVARVQQRDDSWFTLASDQLGIPEPTLRSHAKHGDNLSFAILIYVTRKQFKHFGNRLWPQNTILGILSAASKFNMQDMSPDLRREFCVLWNHIVRKAQNDKNRKISKRILKPIRHVYIGLHQGTNSAPTDFSASTREDHDILDDPDSYPLCDVADHGHDESYVAAPHSHDDPSLSPASLDIPAAPSFPLPALSHVDEGVTTVPLHDNSHITRQTTQSFHVPVTSPDPASTSAMRDPTLKEQKSKTQKRVIVTPAPQLAPEASATSYSPSVPQSLLAPSSASALDNTLHTSASLFFLLLQHHLISVTTHRTPLADRAMHTNTPTTLDPQAPPSSATDPEGPEGAFSTHPVREPNVGRTGGRRQSSFTSPV